MPLVIVPMFADQPLNARLVNAAGAGLVVKPPADAEGTPRPVTHVATVIRSALERVLLDMSYPRAAARLQDEMRTLPDLDELLASASRHASAIGQNPSQ